MNTNIPSENRNPFPSLEPVAMVVLEAGQMLMEAGANAKRVEGIMEMVAQGLGAERVDLRIGYASLSNCGSNEDDSVAAMDPALSNRCARRC